MVKKIILPLDSRFSGEPAFPVGDGIPHVESLRETDNSVEVVRHDEKQAPFPITTLFTKVDRLEDFRPCPGFRQVIFPSWQAIDGDEKGFLRGIYPPRNFMGQVLSGKVRHGWKWWRACGKGGALSPRAHVKGGRKGKSSWD
jgi:hypothetical protein